MLSGKFFIRRNSWSIPRNLQSCRTSFVDFCVPAYYAGKALECTLTRVRRFDGFVRPDRLSGVASLNVGADFRFSRARTEASEGRIFSQQLNPVTRGGNLGSGPLHESRHFGYKSRPPRLRHGYRTICNPSIQLQISSDEDIPSVSTTSPIEDVAVQDNSKEVRLGPMTRSRTKLIEQQVNSLLAD